MNPSNAPKRMFDHANVSMKLPDPGASGTILVDRTPCHVDLVSAAAEARTLADPPREGLDLTISLKTDGGDVTVTADTAINQNGDTACVYADVGDFQKFVSILSGSTPVWREVANDGVALS